MKRRLALVAAVASLCTLVFAIGAGTAAGNTVLHGYTCTIGLPTADNQGVFLTTPISVTVVTDNGAAITHCTFLNTGYTAPGPFPFACFIGPDNIPATITELQIHDDVVVLTCVTPPSG